MSYCERRGSQGSILGSLLLSIYTTTLSDYEASNYMLYTHGTYSLLLKHYLSSITYRQNKQIGISMKD